MYSALEDKNDHFGLFLLFKNISSSHFFRFLNKMTIMRAASQSWWLGQTSGIPEEYAVRPGIPLVGVISDSFYRGATLDHVSVC